MTCTDRRKGGTGGEQERAGKRQSYATTFLCLTNFARAWCILSSPRIFKAWKGNKVYDTRVHLLPGLTTSVYVGSPAFRMWSFRSCQLALGGRPVTITRYSVCWKPAAGRYGAPGARNKTLMHKGRGGRVAGQGPKAGSEELRSERCSFQQEARCAGLGWASAETHPVD